MKHINRKYLSRIFFLLSSLFGLPVFWSFCRVTSKVPSANAKTVEVIKERLKLTEGSIIIVDYSKPSCEDRLYIYDVCNTMCLYSGVVLHGCGGRSTARVPEFSNEEGSNCSSLGLYKVAEEGRMKIAYPCLRLDGLDSTNSNARRRGILVHPSIRVTLLPFEVWGRCFRLTTSSQGCFSVSLHTYYKIKNLKRPIYIYGKI